MEDFSDRFDELFDRLALAEVAPDPTERDQFYYRVALERARDVLRWDVDTTKREIFETRIRLALHLSPREAVDYDSANTTPRWKLIRAYLVDRFGRDPDGAEALARDVQSVLDNWDRDRSAVTGHLNYLIKRDGARCSNCRAAFSGASAVVEACDEYKPYYYAPNELMRPEVDHIEAVSALGTNVVANLQVLCRLCNAGKGRGLGLSVEDEAKFAGQAVDCIPIPHRCRVFYYVVQRDERRCQQCGTDVAELTVRPVLIEGSYIRTNLKTLCLECARDG